MSQTSILTIDPESLTAVHMFKLGTTAHRYYLPISDDQSLYLPTKEGEILVLDSLSGETRNVINLNMPIMSDILVDENNLYCICGVPIRTKFSMSTSNFAVCIIDKNTGEKKFQTAYFQGPPAFILLKHEKLWALGRKQLLCIDKQGNINKTINVPIKPDYPPCIHKNDIVLSYKDGTTFFIDLELNPMGMIKSKPNVSGMIDDEAGVAWLTPYGLLRLNTENKDYEEIITHTKMNNIIPIKIESQFFGCDTTGCLIGFDGDNKSTNIIKMSKQPLTDLLAIDGSLVVMSNDDLCLINL